MPEDNPFRNGALSVVDISHSGSHHDPRVIGPVMNKVARAYHRCVEDLHGKGMCPCCVTLSIFATVAVNVMGGTSIEDRPNVIEAMQDILKDLGEALEEKNHGSNILRLGGKVFTREHDITMH